MFLSPWIIFLSYKNIQLFIIKIIAIVPYRKQKFERDDNLSHSSLKPQVLCHLYTSIPYIGRSSLHPLSLAESSYKRSLRSLSIISYRSFLPPLLSFLLIQMVALVFVQDVPAPAELFAHVSYFLSECSVLTLKESGTHWDLVLLQSTGIAWTLRGLVVLATSTPVLVVLEETQKKKNRGYNKQFLLHKD